MAADEDRVPPWRRYLRLTRDNPAADVDDELAFHLQSAVDEFVAAGMPLEDARAAARAKFGDLEQISRTLHTLSHQRERHMTRADLIDSLKQDVVFGLRQLRKSPAFTLVAVITLGLGIGANSAIFSVVRSVLIRPLPFANVDRVVRLSQRNGNDEMWSVPYGNFDTWRHQATGFEAIGAIAGGGRLTVTGQGEPLPVPTFRATAGYWQALSMPPILGRYFSADEDRAGGRPVAVISEALWRDRFASRRDVIGRLLTVSGQSYAVIGVAPNDYLLPRAPGNAIWLPVDATSSQLNEFADHEWTVYALARFDVALPAALRQVTQIDTRLAHDHPHSFYDGTVTARSLTDVLVGGNRVVLYLLSGAVALVLLIACGNVANLLLARASVRRTEIAVRSALGASRKRLVVQMLVESVLLALAGAALGLVVAVAAIRFLVSSPISLARLNEARLDGSVVGFTLVLAVVCAVLFGLAPALRAARLDLQQTLRDGGRNTRGEGQQRLRQVLVIGELCLTLVLLVGAGLLIRSAFALSAVPVGFNTSNVLVFNVVLPESRYTSDARIRSAFEEMERDIGAVPGVKAVARTQTPPIYGNGWNWTAKREGSDGHDAGAVVADMRFVSPSYFSTLEVPLVRGRAFTAADGPNAPLVAIISRRLAERLWPGIDPVGRRISNAFHGDTPWREIVGVADDVHSDGPRDDVDPVLYIPAAQEPQPSFAFMVRGSVPVTTLLPSIRRAVASVDPLVALSGVSTMEDAVGRLLAMDRFTRVLLTALGITGLLLAIVGVYGVIGYFVTQRQHEVGVRIALGASSRSVQWLVVWQGLMLAGIGVIVGVPIALMATRFLRAFLFGITAHDPVTYLVVAVLLAVVAVLAAYVPARRATRIDPLEALRAS
jgi:putative ABC transport system permease protein